MVGGRWVGGRPNGLGIGGCWDIGRTVGGLWVVSCLPVVDGFVIGAIKKL